MKEIAKLIDNTISEYLSQLKNIPHEIAGVKPALGKWSKKEILGHLIDSASNNHQRFVRAAQNDAKNFPPYNQNSWVEVQQYNNMEWENLIDLFTNLNNHIVRVLSVIPENASGNLCNIGKENLVTLEFIAKDYVRHMRHHLDKIMEK